MVSVDESGNAYDDEHWLEQSRADIAARYARARRHSLLVRILKIALPVLSVGGVAAFLLIIYVLPELPPGISAGSIDISHNSIVMENPHVSGFMSGGRSYEVKADRAEQSLENTKVVTLFNIGATLGFDVDETAEVAAKTGTYYSDIQRIVLNDQISLSTSTGIVGNLQSADIDMKTGTMKSDKPLVFSLDGNRIEANGVFVADRGENISFTDGVKVTYSVADESSAAPGQASR